MTENNPNETDGQNFPSNSVLQLRHLILLGTSLFVVLTSVCISWVSFSMWILV